MGLKEIKGPQKERVELILYFYLICTVIEIFVVLIKDSSSLMRGGLYFSFIYPIICLRYLKKTSLINLNFQVVYFALSAIVILTYIEKSWETLILLIIILFYSFSSIYLFIISIKSKNVQSHKHNKRTTYEMIRGTIDKSKNWVWNWYGECIGYLEDGYLWGFAGDIIGKSDDGEIYSSNGNYIAEIYKGNNRICIDSNKQNKTIDPFEKPPSKRKVYKQRTLTSMYLYPKFKDFNLTDIK